MTHVTGFNAQEVYGLLAALRSLLEGEVYAGFDIGAAARRVGIRGTSAESAEAAAETAEAAAEDT